LLLGLIWPLGGLTQVGEGMCVSGAGSTWPQTKEDVEKHNTRMILNSMVLWVELLPIQGWVFHERAPTQYLSGTYPNVESFHVNIGLPNPLLSCDSFLVCFYEIYLPTIVTHLLPSNSVRVHVFGTFLWPTIDIQLVNHHLNTEWVAYHGITPYRLEVF
jgi:hypothetical protein